MAQETKNLLTFIGWLALTSYNQVISVQLEVLYTSSYENISVISGFLPLSAKSSIFHTFGYFATKGFSLIQVIL